MQQKATLESPGMRPRLHYIPAQLFGPPTDEARQVFAPSQLDAEKLPQLTSVAVISTTAPETSSCRSWRVRSLATYGLRRRRSRVESVASDRGRRKLAGGFIHEQAQDICAFIEALPVEIATTVVHCVDGYAHSCGVSIALRLYGYDMRPQHISNAVVSVALTLTG
jgi:hypothetical protein